MVRCLTLADELKAGGAACHFVTRAQRGDLSATVQQRGHTLHLLPAVDTSGNTRHLREEATQATEPYHASWLLGGWEHDAEQSRAIISDLNPDWLIIDHYGIDQRWEFTLAESYKRLMIIDDLADRDHVCDALLDQNWFGAETTTRYDGKIPTAATRFLGPSYSLLNPDYRILRSLMPPRDGIISRALLFMGGSDPENETEKALKALSTPPLSQLVVDIVLGPNHPDKPGIQRLAKIRTRCTVHQSLPSLAGLMAKADLMVGAGGATTWERMCLGLPSLVISIAANQTPTNEALREAGYIAFLGESANVSQEDIARAICNAQANPESMRAQSQRACALVPGDGAAKIASFLARNH